MKGGQESLCSIFHFDDSAMLLSSPSITAKKQHRVSHIDYLILQAVFSTYWRILDAS